MSWNYRVIRHKNDKDEIWFGFYECYYKNKNDVIPHSWGESPTNIIGETTGDLLDALSKLKVAVEKPILYIKDNKLEVWKGKK
jgi:hypothetical protein